MWIRGSSKVMAHGIPYSLLMLNYGTQQSRPQTAPKPIQTVARSTLKVISSVFKNAFNNVLPWFECVLKVHGLET